MQRVIGGSLRVLRGGVSLTRLKASTGRRGLLPLGSVVQRNFTATKQKDLAQPIKLQHEKKLMNVLEKAKTQDSIQHDLFKFPGFVHPVTQTELIDLTQAALTSPTQEKLLILICPQQKTEAYMEDLVRATSKSVDSGFISTTSQSLFELAEIKSGKSEKSELEKVNTLQYIDPKSAQKFLNQLPAAFLEELMQKQSIPKSILDIPQSVKPKGRKKKSGLKGNSSLAQVLKELKEASSFSKLIIFIKDLPSLLQESQKFLKRTLKELKEENIIIVGCHAMESYDHEQYLDNFIPVQNGTREKEGYMFSLPYSNLPEIVHIPVLPPAEKPELQSWLKQIQEKHEKELIIGNLEKIQRYFAEETSFQWNISLDHLEQIPNLPTLLSSFQLDSLSIRKIVNLAIGKNSSNGGTQSGEMNTEHVINAINLWKQGVEYQTSFYSNQQNLSVKIDRKELTHHEKKLLSCIVPPSDIKIKFSDIGSLDRQKEVLKTLISLPIERPDLFSQGVLKLSTSGVLLFGPPGTGKTLLGKAVASESQANFLNISCSDIFGKYFGDAEKNAKAVFTLARKIQPCVIFLDELDSLFMARSYHYDLRRDVINELMAQWDGLQSRNDGILVMGATNRPFDLDEAVLRRLPRRILVDLPDPKARHEILNLLLREETLSKDFNMHEIVNMTRFYSGSDLKNLAIAAALIAVTESQSSKRVLTMAHFAKALEEIKPSTTEDAATWNELRRWNDIYGERKVKPKPRFMGFN